MAVNSVDTVIVGGGQAGIAISEHLGTRGIDHLILERGRIAERWRSARWDSLVANGPAWHDRFPGLEFEEHDQEEFVPKEAVADYFEDYAAKIGAPVKCGVEVTRVRKDEGQRGFIVESIEGSWQANNVVAATGPFQKPIIPEVMPATLRVFQIHSADYRNPQQLPDGAVMVVGAGSSGAQIAEELMEAGRKVYLSVSAHDRPPRRYRGRDNVWWLGVLGKWEMPTPAPGTEHVTFAVSGAHGGQTVDFRRLAARGITLVGRTESYNCGQLRFADDLRENIAYGDRNYLSVLDEADEFIVRNGLDFPEEPEARERLSDPDCLTNPILELDLEDAGINSVVWATGFSLDFGWLDVDVFDESGHPDHRRGISRVPGVYFLGLPWLSRRGSSFIWGVWHDAKFIADQIAIQRDYMTYSPSELGMSLKEVR